MTVLITGALGFVGRNLSKYLADRGQYLLAIDVASQAGTAYSEFYTWDELDLVDWSRVDAVVHLAGKAHDTRNTSDEKSYFDVNVGFTKKVLEAAVGSWQPTAEKAQLSMDNGSWSRQDAKAQRKFILFSSVKAAADRVEDVLTEEVVPNPQTPYGRSKLEAEKEVLKFGSSEVRELETAANHANRANEEDFRTYILRPCMIHGPGNKGNLNLLYNVVQKGVPWPLGAFDNKRSFASIENVCAVVEGLLTGDAPAGVYQVADDEPLSTNAVISLMANSLGRGGRIWSVPAGLIRWIARCGDLLHLPLNSERLKKLTESYVVSNTKLKAALGWETMPVNAREGLRKTVESFRK